MPIDPRISLGVQPFTPPDVLGGIGKAMSLADMAQTNQMRRQVMQQQEEQARLENEQRQRAAAEDAQIREALSIDGRGEWGRSTEALRRIGSERALKMATDIETAITNQQKAKLEAEEKELKIGAERAAQWGQIAGSVNDEATFATGLRAAVARGLMTKEQAAEYLARPWDESLQAEVKQIAQQSLTVAQQAEQRLKALQEQRAAEMHGPQLTKAQADASLASRTAEGDAPIQPKDRLTSDQLNFERAVKDGSFKGTFEQWLTQDANRKKPVTSITTNVNSQDTFKNESSLRKEFDDLPVVKARNEVKTQVARAEQAYAQALDPKNKGRSTNASDQVIITVLNKVLDPSSVVRESEYGRTAEGQAVMRKLEGYLTKLKTGGAGISSGERDDIMQTIRGLSSAMESRYAPVAEQYRGLAQQYGMEPSRVVGKAAPPTQSGSGSRIKILAVE